MVKGRLVEDVHALKKLGVAAVYRPKDFDLNRIMDDLAGLIEKAAERVACVGKSEY